MRTRIKTEYGRETDPQTGAPRYVMRDVEKFVLDDVDRMSIAADIISGKTSAEEARQQYGLVSINSIYAWIGRYVSATKPVSLQGETNPSESMAKKSPADRVKELEAENKRLQKALELEKLRSKAYDTMIDVAEETFNIPIRKKSGTKQ